MIPLVTPAAGPEHHRLADHSADRRMVVLAAAALIVGTGGAFGAWVLLKLIALATNLFWYGRFSTAGAEINDARHGMAAVIIPVIGSLIIGVMARFGSEKIRGHGIPEAILLGRIPIVDGPEWRVIGLLSRHDLLKARSLRRRSERSRFGRAADHGAREAATIE